MNQDILTRLPGVATVLKSADVVMELEQQPIVPTEFLNSLTPSGMPPHEIHLKVNAPIMLLRNMDPAKGHCNGTRYVVRRIVGNSLIDAEVMGGEYAGKRLLIPRIPLRPSDAELPFTLSRRQFPIRPAFCMTINKAPGAESDEMWRVPP